VTIDIGPIHFVPEFGPVELVFLLLVVGTALSFLARRIRVAEPILLLLGGVALGFIPGLPPIELEPDLVFVLFLPPILFAAAYFTPIRDFRANARPILFLAIGLVLFTTVVVGLVAMAFIPQMAANPAVAFTLGAIVAPPDAVAATAVFRRLGVPRRIVTILEGESLINDASSLIAYRAASIAAVTMAFSLLDSTVAFVVVSLGGIAVGIIVGAVITRALSRTADPLLEIIVSLLAPVTAYLIAEQLFHVSGVLATVVAGLITGRKAARVLSADARLMGRGVWSAVIWVINTFVFMLIGLQLPAIIEDLNEWSAAELIAIGAIISATVIVTRIVWVFPATYLPRRLSARIRAREPYPPPAGVFIVSWAGMRGVVSLAAALALAVDFPLRDLILYLTFCVILATLVGQGLTLPWLIRRLGVVAADGPDTEEAHARLAAVEAALGRLDELADEYPGHLELIDQLRQSFDHEATHAWPHAETPPDEAEQERLDHAAIRTAVIVAQREAVIQLRDGGVINDETLRTIERDLDLETLRAAE
jgi:CPA1 family monovalent cation:H+ antiporter